MATLEDFQTLVTVIGIPSIIGGFIYIGRKLQVLDNLDRVTMHEIRPAITDLQERVSSIEGKIGQIVQSRSPLSMTDKGEKILEASGLKDYIDTHQNELIDFCKQNFNMETAYDIQEAAFAHMAKKEFELEIENKIKDAAFNNAISLDLVRMLGGIYFRDLCLQHFNKDTQELGETQEAIP